MSIYASERGPEVAINCSSLLGGVGLWLFTFVTVFAGGIGIQMTGWKTWIWPLTFNVLGALFVFFMCPDVSARVEPFPSARKLTAKLNSPQEKH